MVEIQRLSNESINSCLHEGSYLSRRNNGSDEYAEVQVELLLRLIDLQKEQNLTLTKILENQEKQLHPVIATKEEDRFTTLDHEG